MRQMKCSELVFDGTVYPRANVDPQHVSHIAQAIQAGATLPPIVICKKTKRVVDGMHRIRALQKVHGPDAAADVVEKSYRNDKELFLDAMRFNATHGRNLSTYDRAHCAITAANLEIDDASVAECLSVTPAYVDSLRVNRAATSGKLSVPIKRTIAHKAGETLTKEQVTANDKLSGMSQSFYFNQIITLIENDLLDLTDDRLMERVRRLHELLAGLLVSA